MPEHNPPSYLKFNSHMSYIRDEERNNPNVSRYMDWYSYDYSYFFDMIRKIVPLALIVQLEDGKFVFQANLKESCPKNCTPKYIFGVFQSYEDYMCDSQFGLIKLGQLGHNLDQSRCTMLKLFYKDDNGELIQRNQIGFEYDCIFSADKITDTEMSFYHADSSEILKLTISLRQENIEDPQLVYQFIGVSQIRTPHIQHAIRYSMNEIYSFESTSISPQIERNGITENVFYSQIRINYSSGWDTGINVFTYDNNSRQINRSIKIKELSGEYQRGISFVLVNQSNSGIYLFQFGGRKHGVYKMTEHSQSDYAPEYEEIPFKNYQQFYTNIELNRMSVASCAMTRSKHLVLIQGFPTENTITIPTSFQNLFTSKFMWLLVDLDTHIIKRIYPRVYDLADLSQKSANDFKTVHKKRRKGRLEAISTFPDGDLNGGYSDPILIQAIKKSNTSEMKNFKHNNHSKEETSDSFVKPKQQLIPLPKNPSSNPPKLFSFRPFYENPDLFQVHLSIPYSETISDSMIGKKGPTSYGNTFRFFFKLRNEAICKHSKLLAFTRNVPTFSDMTINTQ